MDHPAGCKEEGQLSQTTRNKVHNLLYKPWNIQKKDSKSTEDFGKGDSWISLKEWDAQLLIESPTNMQNNTCLFLTTTFIIGFL